MNLRLSVLLLLVLASFTVLAQDKPKKKIARPDIPGSFFLDLGVTRGSHTPNNWKQGLWGSRTLNVYYQYPMRLLHSKFSFNPGVGFGFDRFKLINEYTLNPQGSGVFQLDPVNIVFPNTTARKSMIIADYFDIPLDFRFDTRPEDRSRSFSITLGGRFGVLYNSFTKVKYTSNGETITVKDKQRFGLNPIRYGVYMRIGAGSFNWFWNYNLSPYFSSGKGPDATKMTTMTFGVSIGGL